MSFKLSICIPTYNRAALLRETLENVIAQATNEVEIVVSDNASPDNTEEIVRGFQKRFPRLTYFRQSENRGADRNYLNAVACAQGEYCWLLGDDDLLEDGAIACLLEKYLSRPVDFVQLSVTAYDVRMETVTERSIDKLEVYEDLYTTDTLSFFARFFQESYLSVFVVKREKWNSVDPAKYIGTGLTYLAIVYEYLQPQSPVQFVAQPLVKYRGGNASWSGSTLDVVVGHMNFVLASLPERYASVKPEARRRYEKRVPVTLEMLAGLRADGHYDIPRYRKYIAAYFAQRPGRRTLARALASAPPGLLRLLRHLHRQSK